MGRRRAAFVLVALTLVGTACSSGGGGKKAADGAVDDDAVTTPVGPQTYTIDVDVPSPEGMNLQASVFLPINVQVRPGDTVVFENRSTQAPHTVTFGAKESLTPEAPAPMTKSGQPNPLVFAPCYAATVPAPGAEACPEPLPASPPQFNGAGFWNSGALAPTTAPGRHSATLTFAPEIAPGTYDYTCLLHPSMSGLIEVVPNDDLRKPPSEVAKQAKRQAVAVDKAGKLLKEPAPPITGGPAVTAGWGDQTVTVNRFSPAVIEVKAGEKVTWKGASPSEPHTITFESPFKSPEESGVFTPGGTKAGGRYEGGFAHSGLIGPQPFPAEAFSLVFTKPGTYSYVCVLHPDMGGQVIVTS